MRDTTNLIHTHVRMLIRAHASSKTSPVFSVICETTFYLTHVALTLLPQGIMNVVHNKDSISYTEPCIFSSSLA